MIKQLVISFYCVVLIFCMSDAQDSSALNDTSIIYKNQTFQLREVVVRNNFNVPAFIDYVKNDTTFYKAFKNLRILSFTSFNHIQMLDKSGNTEASLDSKTRQTYANGCRTMQVLMKK